MMTFEQKKPPVAVIALSVVNLVLFVLPDLFQWPVSLETLLYAGGMYGYAGQDGEYYRLLTAAFLHFSFTHLINNLFVGAILGYRLERITGSLKFFVIYLLSAIGANVVSMYYYGIVEPYALSVGASGAVFGIVGALFAVSIRDRSVTDLTPGRIAIYAALSLYSGFATTGVNNIAHLSGLVFGFLLGLALYRPRKEEPYAAQDIFP